MKSYQVIQKTKAIFMNDYSINLIIHSWFYLMQVENSVRSTLFFVGFAQNIVRYDNDVIFFSFEYSD